MKTLYETLLDDIDSTMDRMDDGAIKHAIGMFWNSRFNLFDVRSSKHHKIKIDKDKRGWYIDVELDPSYPRLNTEMGLICYGEQSTWEGFINNFNKRLSQAPSLAEEGFEPIPYFRIRKVKGDVHIQHNQGLRDLSFIEECDTLFISEMPGKMDLGKMKINNYILLVDCFGPFELTGHPKVKEVLWAGSGYNAPKVNFNVPIIKRS